MQKQITRALALFGLLFLSAAFTSTSAQGARLIVVHIPFEFVVGNERLPAGDYTVRRIVRDSEKALLIRGTDGSAAAIVHTNAVETKAASPRAKLTFTQYDEQYFLSQVWTPGSRIVRELTKSRLQRSLESEPGGSDVATDRRGEARAVGKTVTIIAGAR